MKEPDARQKTLLVGLGNPLSGDDGFGARVVELLQRNGTVILPDVSLVDAGTDLLNHIESFAEYDRVVLIDAILDPEASLACPACVLVLMRKHSFPGPKRLKAFTRFHLCWP